MNRITLVVMVVMAGACGGGYDNQPASNATPTPDATTPSQSTPDDVRSSNPTVFDTVAPDVWADTGPGPADVGDTRDDSDVSPPLPSDVIGQLNLVWLAPDYLFEYPELHAQASFSPMLAASGLENPVGWLASAEGYEIWAADGFWVVPPVGETAEFDASQLWQPAGVIDDYLDTGGWLSVGEHLVLNLDEIIAEQHGALLYEALLDDGYDHALLQPNDAEMDVAIAGGADVGAQRALDRVSVPPAVVLTNLDPSRPVPIRAGADFVLKWAPSLPPPAANTDTILIVLLSGAKGRVVHVEDTGEIDLTSVIEPFLFDASALDLSITRLRRRQVQLNEGQINVVAASRQFLTTLRVGAWDVTPTILEVGRDHQLTLRVWDVQINPSNVYVESDPPLTITDVTVADTEGHVLTMTVSVPGETPTGPLGLTVGTWDGDAGASSRTPQVQIPEAAWLVDALPNSGDCESALDEGFLADGTWIGDDLGLPADDFYPDGGECTYFGPGSGREQAIPVALSAGETLTVRSWRERGQSSLYLADSCGGWILGCAEALGPGLEAEFSYTADIDEELLLVLDSHNLPDGPGESFVVDVRRSEPAGIVLWDTEVVAGLTSTIAVISLVGDITEEATFDFGDAATVSDVALSDPPDDYAEVTLVFDSDVPLEVIAKMRLDGETWPAGEPIVVKPFASSLSCEEADAVGPLQPGLYDGFTLGEFYQPAGLGACVNGFGLGSESVVRVDLGAGETLRATMYADDADAMLYLTTGCDTAPLLCVDAQGNGTPEVLEWTAPAQPTTVYLITDTFNFSFGDTFALELEVLP